MRSSILRLFFNDNVFVGNDYFARYLTLIFSLFLAALTLCSRNWAAVFLYVQIYGNIWVGKPIVLFVRKKYASTKLKKIKHTLT